VSGIVEDVVWGATERSGSEREGIEGSESVAAMV